MLFALCCPNWIRILWITGLVSHTIPTLSNVIETTTTTDSSNKLQCLDIITVEEILQINDSITSLCIVNCLMPQIQEDTLSRFYNLKILVLVNVSLTEVLPNAFANLSQLTKVDLANNRISSLSPFTFQFNQKLKELLLKGNQIIEVQSIALALSIFPSFHYLDLSRNSIKKLNDSDTNLANLEILILKECELTTFSSSLFASLKKLHLGNNFLNSEGLDLAAFNNSENLMELHLGNLQTKQKYGSSVYNYFPEIKSNFLPYLPKLLLLDMQNCDIASISSLAFNTLPSLEILILRSNNLPTISSSISSLKSLQKLDMSYNGKKELGFELKYVNFSKMQSLNYLNLSYNKLKLLSANAFYGLTNLTILSLESTELTYIEPYAFRSLKSLLYLDLSNNHLTVIINDTFADLISLTHLKLSRNSLKIYKENHPFLPTINLQVLEFQHNSLCELWDYLIPHLTNLTYLDMSYNKIVQWKWDGFPSSGNLKQANFEDNEITAMTRPMLENLLTLKKGVFSNNPYNCTDCEITNVKELLKSTIYFPYKDEYRCQYKYQKNDDFVFNATLPPQCYNSSFHYTGIGIGIGFILILMVILASLTYHFRWYIRYRWFVARCHLKTWHKPLQRKQSYLYDAFISYSDKDRYWIKNEFLPRLENDFHFHFCIHDRDFEPGRNITDNIFEGIDRSKMFIAIITENFLVSQWCLWEMNMAISKMAIEQSDNLVIIKLHTISRDKLSRSIHYLMKTKTYLSWPVTSVGQHLFWERMNHILHKCTSNAKRTANDA